MNSEGMQWHSWMVLGRSSYGAPLSPGTTGTAAVAGEKEEGGGHASAQGRGGKFLAYLGDLTALLSPVGRGGEGDDGWK